MKIDDIHHYVLTDITPFEYQIMRSHPPIYPYLRPMKITVRPATTADLPALLHFEQGVISAERPIDPTIRDGPIRYYDLDKMLASPHIYLVVAETEEDVAGSKTKSILVGSGYARIDPSRHYLRHTHHAYCGFMYVQPAFRGQGVNRLIIDALKSWARSQGLTELRLDVYTTNDIAIRAYEKAGFTPYLINMRMGI
ncbi:MAG TPA: GNAT family N-acetyltransferase [Puia sp.]|jgi:ribosomal protein S18 acetylase RimI-like enzyme|nr:GNAT family N-acetyltransferase [Puia sp.]